MEKDRVLTKKFYKHCINLTICQTQAYKILNLWILPTRKGGDVILMIYPEDETLILSTWR
jgi:hypothetical protein